MYGFFLFIILASGIFSDSASDNVDSFFYEIGRYIQSFSGSVDPQGNSQDVNNVIDSGIETTIAGKNLFVQFHELIINLILLITSKTNTDVNYNTVVILSMVITGIVTGFTAWRIAKASGIVLAIVLVLIFIIWGFGISTVFTT